jgi:predicted nucleotidyltransferase
VVGQRDEGVALGVFGSFVSGGWGVGSDLDLVAVVSGASQPFPRRVTARDDRFADILRNHTRWLVDRRDTPAPA